MLSISAMADHDSENGSEGLRLVLSKLEDAKRTFKKTKQLPKDGAGARIACCKEN